VFVAVIAPIGQAAIAKLLPDLFGWIQFRQPGLQP
jgi:hypothetical protein